MPPEIRRHKIDRLVVINPERTWPLLALLQEIDLPTLRHSLRVGMLAHDVASYAEWDRSMITLATTAGFLHDIGKTHPGFFQVIQQDRLHLPLNEEQIDIVRLHPAHGALILAQQSLPRECILAAEQHHENWDGTGYPHNIRGAEINELATLISYCDRFDAIQAPDRFYNPAPFPLGLSDAIDWINKQVGTGLSPLWQEAFNRMAAGI